MSLRDRYLYRLVRLLESEGVEKIAACTAQLPWHRDGALYGRIFVKKTSKKYLYAEVSAADVHA